MILLMVWLKCSHAPPLEQGAALRSSWCWLHLTPYNITKKKKKEKEAKGGLNRRSHVTWKQVIFAVVGKKSLKRFWSQPTGGLFGTKKRHLCEYV